MTTKWKKIWLALVTLLLIFLFGEMGFSTYYYHKHCSECSRYSLAWIQLIEIAKNKFSPPPKEKQEVQLPQLRTTYLNYDFKTRLSVSHFKSYHEFAKHACIPCHYGTINGTDISKLIKDMQENDLQKYLEASLTHNMPPDEVFRKVLLGKLNFLQKQFGHK